MAWWGGMARRGGGGGAGGGEGMANSLGADYFNLYNFTNFTNFRIIFDLLPSQPIFERQVFFTKKIL